METVDELQEICMDFDRAAEMVASELSSRAVPGRAGGMMKYMKSTTPCLGVDARGQHEVISLAARLFIPPDRDGYEGLVRRIWSLPSREEKHVAIGLAQAHRRFVDFDSLGLYELLIREGAWWDHVDWVAIHCVGEALVKDRQPVSAFMRNWIGDSCMWVRRAALLCQVGHRRQADAGMLFEFCLARSHEKEFFIRKAIGWALRDYSYESPDAVAGFLEANRTRLSGLSCREGARALVRKGLLEIPAEPARGRECR